MAVTKAQIEAGRAANAAFKAAQASGNQQAAASIVSSAAKSLGVSQSSSWFQTVANRVKAIQPKAEQLPPQQQLQQQPWQQQLQKPTQQQNYNLSNLSNSFGDVGINQTRDIYKWEWLKLSTWDIITDKSAVWDMTKINDYLKFWKEAEQIESQNKWFLAARNDAIVMDIFKNNPKITQENVDKLIIDYIKAKDPGWTFNTWTEWQAAVNNTLAAIKSRMWYIPSEKEDLTKKAEDAFDREIADIESQYNAEKSAFMKAGAIEDRYTNFNEVNDKIQSTLEAAGKHRAENLYTWMPTDQQIWEIAQSLWQDFATTKKIMEWRGYEDLEMQWEFKEKSERPYERMFEDLELNRSRTLADIETKHVRTQTALNEQVDDVKTQMERTLAVWEKAGALSWAIRSSGYVQWLDNIRQDAIKNMDRLKVRKDWDTEDTAMNKGRVIEDFNINMTRAKQDLETTLNEIKTTNGAALWQYLNEYAPSSSELTRKLNELEDKFAIKSQQAFQLYTQNLRGITDTMTYDTEKALQIEWMKQQLQQTNVNNLLANNGMALAWINYWDLSTMLKNWDISPTDYTAMAGYMKTLGISQLQSMGIPTPQDFELYNQMLEQWMTPQQAIQAVIGSAPSRFSQSTTDANIWKTVNTDNWVFQYNPQTQRYDIPVWKNQVSIEQYASSIPDYTPANQSDIQKWQVFLYEKKVWSYGWQCGSFVNDYLQRMWLDRLFMDPIDAKKAVKNSDIPTVWWIAIIDWSNNPNATQAQQKYWHVAIIKSINNDWTLTLKDSNHGWDEKVHERNIDQRKVSGYFDPTQWKTSIYTPIEDTIWWAAFKWLSEDDQTFVKALTNYQVDLPWRASKNYTQIMAAATELDPTFNAYEYANRKSFANDWNKKRIAWGNLSKVATAVQHLWELEHIMSQMKWQSELQIKNEVMNRAKEKLWMPNITSFKQAEAAVVSELAWAYKWNASPSEADREEFAKSVWVKMSPKQMDAWINWAARLLFWKINTEALAYSDVMWKRPDSIFTQDWFDFLENKWLDVWYYFNKPSNIGWQSLEQYQWWTVIGWWTTSSWPVTLSDIFR